MSPLRLSTTPHIISYTSRIPHSQRALQPTPIAFHRNEHRLVAISSNTRNLDTTKFHLASEGVGDFFIGQGFEANGVGVGMSGETSSFSACSGVDLECLGQGFGVCYDSVRFGVGLSLSKSILCQLLSLPK